MVRQPAGAAFRYDAHQPRGPSEYSVRRCRRAFFLAMAEALTLATDTAAFDAFLRDTHGIEGNIFSVMQARAAARTST